MINEHHGKSYTRLYNIWRGMKQRCNNPNHTSYKQYGGRGIKVCPQWEHDFVRFERWALANGYNENLTIDRIDNDKGYNPGNCQWITKSDNSKGKNKPITRKTFYYETDPEILKKREDMKHYRRMLKMYNELVESGVDPNTIRKPMPPD